MEQQLINLSKFYSEKHGIPASKLVISFSHDQATIQKVDSIGYELIDLEIVLFE